MSAWKKKAMAFVTRSHRHLWGKNNEDPLVFLFTRGLKNQFAKELLLGWNKFSQERPIQNWGLNRVLTSDEKLFLPSGIVIPYIVEKELVSVFIHPYEEHKNDKTTMIPGSLSPTMVLGEKKKKIAIIQDIFDGLFLFQETCETCCVVIHPDPDLPLSNHCRSILKTAGTLFIFSSDKIKNIKNKKAFLELPDHCFYAYQSKEQLIPCVV